MSGANRGATLRLLFDEGPPPGESYLFSAAQHEKIVEAPPRLSGTKLRALMRNSVSNRKTEIFDAAPPRESEYSGN
jgi:DNA-binding GntR family transcriptional regulator